MTDAATSARDELLAFALALDERVCDEVRVEPWGRAFLTPSTPLIWDANWVAIERPGTAPEEVVAIADRVLGGAGLAHRTVCITDEAEGRRLGGQLEADPARWPGWEVERARFMVWRGAAIEASARPAPASARGAREVRLAEIEDLRRALIAEEAVPSGVAEPEATVAQLLELDRRYGEAAGDRWFVAPAAGEPLAACRLLRRGGIGQVEDVGTRFHARERGHAKAVVRAAIAASRAAGDATTFLTADAADWPQLLYSRLGFESVGDLTVLRRRP